jgi:hypothetical protein
MQPSSPFSKGGQIRDNAFHTFLDASDSLLVVPDLLDAVEPREPESIAAVDPLDASFSLKIGGDLGQGLLINAQSCRGAASSTRFA